MRKICFFTGSRAEYGILSRLMKKIKDSVDCELQIIATNMHLSPEFGLTYKEIEGDGLFINKKVEMLLSSDSNNGIVKSMGLGTIGFADALEDLKPDICVILGDRYEMLAAAQATLIYKIPIAHIGGGAITEGAYDDCIRHAITKMSHFHFTSTEEYCKRVIQLGEQPDRVFNVGAIGIENIKKIPLLPKEELEESLGFEMGEKCLLVTYHPVTLENASAEWQSRNLLEALDDYPNYKVIFTMPNSDTNGRIIMQAINEWVSKHSHRSIAFKSLGLKRYLSALQFVTAVVGNSSSGIIEVPSFGIPTLNIGDRQKGRIAADSVYHCAPTKETIVQGLAHILSDEFKKKVKNTSNPYEGTNTTEQILNVLKNYPLDTIVQKSFYNL